MATPSQTRLVKTSSGRARPASQAPATKATQVRTISPTVIPAERATAPAVGAASPASSESTRWANVSKTSGTGREGRRAHGPSIRFGATNARASLAADAGEPVATVSRMGR